jgi:hypothetical protein
VQVFGTVCAKSCSAKSNCIQAEFLLKGTVQKTLRIVQKMYAKAESIFRPQIQEGFSLRALFKGTEQCAA